MSSEQLIIETLEEFGLPTNAAKAVFALLRKNPTTGYEIIINRLRTFP